jgi:hypothetical protein
MYSPPELPPALFLDLLIAWPQCKLAEALGELCHLAPHKNDIIRNVANIYKEVIVARLLM